MIPLEDIIRGCKRYDRSSQQLLYEKYVSLMRGLCFRYLSNASDVNDVVHDGFIKVFISIHQFSFRGSFEGWMKRIFINMAIKHNCRDPYSIENFTGFETGQVDIDEGDGISYNHYEAVLMADFSRDEMLEVVKRLPEKLRIVFNLYCIEDFSHEEISELLKIDIVTSRTRLLRARNQIKKELYEISLSRSFKESS